LVGVNHAEVRRALNDEAVAILRRQRFDGLDDFVDQRPQSKRVEVQLIRPASIAAAMIARNNRLINADAAAFLKFPR
jgi:hypothetical protein